MPDRLRHDGLEARGQSEQSYGNGTHSVCVATEKDPSNPCDGPFLFFILRGETFLLHQPNAQLVELSLGRR
jgi:hypothetical protein